MEVMWKAQIMRKKQSMLIIVAHFDPVDFGYRTQNVIVQIEIKPILIEWAKKWVTVMRYSGCKRKEQLKSLHNHWDHPEPHFESMLIVTWRSKDGIASTHRMRCWFKSDPNLSVPD